MTEKVKVTQRQADWLGIYKTATDIAYAIDIQPLKKRPDSPIVDWPASKVAKALYGGYEVEEEYKIRDWIAYLDGSNFNGYHKGKVEQITSVGEKYILYNVDCCQVEIAKIRHATPEEIKAEQERRVWAKIGREVGEFKVGDRYVYHNGVTATVGVKNHRVSAKAAYESGQLKGFYPAESFIEFGGGEE